jgi:hypothetical protein
MDCMIQASIPSIGKKIFPFPESPDRLCGPPASYSMGTRVLSLEVKQLGHEVDNSPSSSTNVKNE